MVKYVLQSRQCLNLNIHLINYITNMLLLDWAVPTTISYFTEIYNIYPVVLLHICNLKGDLTMTSSQPIMAYASHKAHNVDFDRYSQPVLSVSEKPFDATWWAKTGLCQIQYRSVCIIYHKKLPTFIAIINLKTITKMLHNYIFKFSYNNHIKTVYVNSIKTVYVTWMIHHFVHVLRICYVNIMYFSLRNILRNYYVKKSTRFFVIIT